ncbi:MAG: hypothetical protein K0S33_155 [Bacteroidetes bacterium]|jgi:hypothetical protein|nr:hypothetical protein [Bacteroidota bacterium]
MKYFLFILVCSFSLLLQAQLPSKNISNKNTEDHILIPGSHMYIVPAKGFKLAKDHMGLQNANGALVLVFDIDGGNYSSNTATFTRENFERKGAKVLEFEEFVFNGFPAKYIHMQGDDLMKNHTIVFGDSTFSASVMGNYDASNEMLGQEMKASILSIIYEKNRKVNPFETARFILNDSVSLFKFVKFTSNMFMYWPNGVEDKENEEAATVFVTQMPFPEGSTLFTISETIFNSIKRYGTIEKKEKERFDVMNDFRFYECEARSMLNGHEKVLYQFVAADKGTAIVIQCTSPPDSKKNISEFKKLAYTLRFK